MRYSKSKNRVSFFRMYILKTTLVFFCLWNLSAFSQSGDKAVLKVYLTDAETGRNVKKARVTLEGFEIPAIDGMYDKKGRYYYFTEIPKGYNTVMSYHKDYNEKGFQDVNGLPNEVRLKLYDPLNVSYSFEKPVLRSINKSYIHKPRYLRKLEDELNTNDSVVNKSFRYIYVEDPYHIAVITKLDKYNFLKDPVIKNILENLVLEFSPSIVDEGDVLKCNCYGFKFNGDFYKSIESTFNGKYVNNCDTISKEESGYRVYFLNKKDKSKFKRFNSKEIFALRQVGLFVTAITTKEIEYFGEKKFIFSNFSGNARSILFDSSQNIDKYYIFNRYTKPIQYFFESEKEDLKNEIGKVQAKMLYGSFDEDNILFKTFFVTAEDDSIGLGALDNKSINNSINLIFFNSFYIKKV